MLCPAAQTTYEVAVYTSDVKGAGTDANLSCTLHGSVGSSPALQLAGGRGAFERGKVGWQLARWAEPCSSLQPQAALLFGRVSAQALNRLTCKLSFFL